MYDLCKDQQSKLTTVLMEYLNANDWKALFAETGCETFAHEHTQFYQDEAWEEESLAPDCVRAVDYMLAKDAANLKIIWELAGVKAMTKRKDESLANEIQTLIEQAESTAVALDDMFTHFESERLSVRPMTEHDAAFMFDHWTQEQDIAKYMIWKPHQSIDETQRFVKASIEGWEKQSYTWIIEKKQTHTIVGSFAARRDDFKVDVVYLLVKQAWGKGYMSELLSAFIQQAFKVEGILRIGATCDVANFASKRVMEKAGMSFEGILKQWTIHPNLSDRPRDCFSLSIVKAPCD